MYDSKTSFNSSEAVSADFLSYLKYDSRKWFISSEGFNHRCHMAAFVVFADHDHSKLPALCWLSKLYKISYTSRSIANYSSFDTIELSIFFYLLPYCD